MSIDPQQLSKRIADFKSDLKSSTPSEVVHKHILTGSTAVIAESNYFEIRKRTASSLGICPSEVIVVGSCKLGFSLKDEDPYAPVRIDSDIDVTVVSHALFDRYSEAVFRYANNDTAFRFGEDFKLISVGLTMGWVMPHSLPPMRAFTDLANWLTLFQRLTSERVHGAREPRSISGRLYINWSRLQAFQEVLVKKRRHDLAGLKK